jgi:DNA polymerase III alpha subunit
MALQRDKFIKGCMEHSGWEKARAEEVWTKIEPFASYGFNKAHSVSYGRVAYITAYLKANWPAEYMSAVLTHEAGDVDKVAISVNECARLGIKVLPPNVNESYGNFGVVAEKTIRFGLFSIKNFGEGIGSVIIKERKANGKFKHLEDFLNRIKDKNLNKKSLESLIKAGAMDEFGDRGTMLANLQDMLDYNRERTKMPDNQDSLFGVFGDTTGSPVQHLKLKDAEKAGLKEKLLWEKELLGLYVSGHPLDEYVEKSKEYVPIAKVHKVVAHDIEEFEMRQMKKERDEETRLQMINERNVQNGLPSKTIEEMKAEQEEKAKNAPKKKFNKEELRKQMAESRPKERMANILGMIEEVKEIPTKKDPSVRMMFLRVVDKTGAIEVVVFPKAYDQFKEKIKVDTCAIIKGRTSSRNGTASLMLENVVPLK